MPTPSAVSSSTQPPARGSDLPRRAGLALAGIFGVLIVLVGLAALLRPTTAAVAFGLPLAAAGDAGFVQALGGRDLCLGLFTLWLVRAGPVRALRWYLGVVGTVPLGDALLVLTRAGWSPWLGLHAAGLGYLLATVLCLAAARPGPR